MIVYRRSTYVSLSHIHCISLQGTARRDGKHHQTSKARHDRRFDSRRHRRHRSHIARPTRTRPIGRRRRRSIRPNTPTQPTNQGRRILPVHQLAQLRPDARRRRALGTHATRRIIVHREDGHTTITATVHQDGLTRKTAVAVQTRVAARTEQIRVAEEPRAGVVVDAVDDGAAGHPRVDEGRVDARAVVEGGDVGHVDAEAVAVGQEALAGGRGIDERLHEVGGETSHDRCWVWETGARGRVDVVVRGLSAIGSRERNGGDAAVDRRVGRAIGTRQRVQVRTQIITIVRAGKHQIGHERAVQQHGEDVSEGQRDAG